jgi:hypothetical protein
MILEISAMYEHPMIVFTVIQMFVLGYTGSIFIKTITHKTVFADKKELYRHFKWGLILKSCYLILTVCMAVIEHNEPWIFPMLYWHQLVTYLLGTLIIVRSNYFTWQYMQDKVITHKEIENIKDKYKF